MHHPCIRCRHFPNSSACESLRGDALSGHRHASPPIYSLAHPTALALLLRHSTTDPDLVLSFWKPRNRSLVPRNGTERLGTHPSQHLVAASCQSGSPWPPPSMSQCPSVPKNPVSHRPFPYLVLVLVPVAQWTICLHTRCKLCPSRFFSAHIT